MDQDHEDFEYDEQEEEEEEEENLSHQNPLLKLKIYLRSPSEEMVPSTCK